MNWKNLFWIIPLVFVIAYFLGIGTYVIGDNLLMEGYDLYFCVYNNADMNNFNKHPAMIEKIQQECICFHNNNYTNILDLDCSEYIKTANNLEAKK